MGRIGPYKIYTNRTYLGFASSFPWIAHTVHGFQIDAQRGSELAFKRSNTFQI